MANNIYGVKFPKNHQKGAFLGVLASVNRTKKNDVIEELRHWLLRTCVAAGQALAHIMPRPILYSNTSLETTV